MPVLDASITGGSFTYYTSTLDSITYLSVLLKLQFWVIIPFHPNCKFCIKIICVGGQLVQQLKCHLGCLDLIPGFSANASFLIIYTWEATGAGSNTWVPAALGDPHWVLASGSPAWPSPGIVAFGEWMSRWKSFLSVSQIKWKQINWKVIVCSSLLLFLCQFLLGSSSSNS